MSISPLNDVFLIAYGFDETILSCLITWRIDLVVVEVTRSWIDSLVVKATNRFVFRLVKHEDARGLDIESSQKIQLIF